MTVRECFEFSTELKLPELFPNVEKKKMIDDIINRLNIKNIEKNIIGGFLTRVNLIFIKGISGGEKRSF
jgi:ABC-type multidrug transport system ATPase subunit